MKEKITVDLDIDTTAIKEATAALQELTVAAEKAKAALDAMFEPRVINVGVDADVGVRPIGARFRGL